MNRLILLILLGLAINVNAQTLKKNILNPDIWLRADILNDNKAIWPDMSGNGNNAVIRKGDTILSGGLINFNKAILFDGIRNKFTIPYDLSATTQLTVIAVYDAKGTLQEQGIWEARINSVQGITLTSQRATGPQSITRYADDNINFPVVNASVQFWGEAIKDTVQSSINLGNGDSDMEPFVGNMAEYWVFNRLLSSLELQMVQSYLSIKYGTTLLYTDYITSTGAVTWNYQANQSYSQTIAGLGRDDGFSLNQKQSFYSGEPYILTIGAGQIASSNDKNPYVLKNGDFLVWGDNGESMETSKSDQNGVLYRYALPARRWLMDVSSKSASGIPSQIRFNTLALSSDPKQCWLVIDRSGTGDFSSSGTIYLQADSIDSKGQAWFNNVNWDTDGSGTDLFTFSCGAGETTTNAVNQNAAFVNDSTGSAQGKGIYNYRLFPNPSDGKYKLELTLNEPSEVNIQIFNSKGNLVKQDKGTGASYYQFDGKLTASGLYFVHIITKKGHETFKLIVN